VQPGGDPEAAPDVFNYRSNFGWESMHAGAPFEGMTSVAEQTLFIRHAHGIECTIPTPPPPPPPPCPPLPPSCLAVLKKFRAHRTPPNPKGCGGYIRQHSHQEIAAHCGPKYECVVQGWCK